jgi:hypothetical protein
MTPEMYLISVSELIKAYLGLANSYYRLGFAEGMVFSFSLILSWMILKWCWGKYNERRI